MHDLEQGSFQPLMHNQHLLWGEALVSPGDTQGASNCHGLVLLGKLSARVIRQTVYKVTVQI